MLFPKPLVALCISLPILAFAAPTPKGAEVANKRAVDTQNGSSDVYGYVSISTPYILKAQHQD